MRTPEALDAKFRDLILSIYTRPQMHAGPQEVESVLWVAHWCWSLLHERENEFQRLNHELHLRQQSNRPHYYQWLEVNPTGSERDAYRFVLERWATISRSLGLVVPDARDHST